MSSDFFINFSVSIIASIIAAGIMALLAGLKTQNPSNTFIIKIVKSETTDNSQQQHHHHYHYSQKLPSKQYINSNENAILILLFVFIMMILSIYLFAVYHQQIIHYSTLILLFLTVLIVVFLLTALAKNKVFYPQCLLYLALLFIVIHIYFLFLESANDPAFLSYLDSIKASGFFHPDFWKFPFFYLFGLSCLLFTTLVILAQVLTLMLEPFTYQNNKLKKIYLFFNRSFGTVYTLLGQLIILGLAYSIFARYLFALLSS